MKKPVGALIYRGWYEFGDPFHHFDGIDAISQSDFLQPRPRKGSGSFWPALDIALLLAIQRKYPDTRFILSSRSPDKTAESIANWFDLMKRIEDADITGLPRGLGGEHEHLVRWIETQIDAIRQIFGRSENFLDVDITSEGAKEKLEAFLDTSLPWWGKANAGRREFAGIPASVAKPGRPRDASD